MTEVLFYHLERASLEDVLPGLLEKSLERGWRAVVRVGAKDRVARLDDHLWNYREESFLPHAAAGPGPGNGPGPGPGDGEGVDDPIWLTDGDDRPNDPQIVFLVDNAPASVEALDGLTRCVLIFDGRDEDAKGAARGFWKAVSAAGYEATYWKQSAQGRWEKQG